MHVLEKARKFIIDADYRFLVLSSFGMYNSMSDEEFLKRKFKATLGYELNLDNPKSFNEKLQWLKLHDRNPKYTMMVDKYEVKKYVASIIGEEYIIPTLGVWERFEDINFDTLPDQFVLKCTHDSGGLVICKDKKKLDINAARKKINRCLKNDYYLVGREWPYKNVKRRIIAERYMSDINNEGLMDYKFLCFDGKVHGVFVCSERFSEDGLKVTFFDNDWNKLKFERHYPSSRIDIPKPMKLKEMEALAERISKDIPFVRSDFYVISGDLYFGELTFYPGNGFEEFTPESVDYEMGELIKLPGGGYIINKNDICIWLHYENKDAFYDDQLRDYKFYCCDGKVKFMMIASERFSAEATKATYFDRCFKKLDFSWGYKTADIIPDKPSCFEEMCLLAEKLSIGIPQVRVDFYLIGDKIYFGELTFFDGGGFDRIEPRHMDFELGEYIHLPERAN